MTLPLPIIQSSLLAFGQLLRATSAHEIALRRQEVTAHIASLHYELRRMELSVQQERIHAQKEVLLSLINAAQHIFDRKMDFFASAFQRAHQLLDSHHAILAQEMVELRSSLQDDNLSDAQYLRLNSRLGEVSVQLSETIKLSRLLSHEFNEQVRSISLNISDFCKDI